MKFYNIVSQNIKLKKLAPTMALTVVGLCLNIASAWGATFDFNWLSDTGYSAIGSFTTKDDAPTSFTEEAGNTIPFTTQFLESVSLSVFDANNFLLDSGSSVTNGSSSDEFLLLSFDGGTNTITGIDVSTQFPANQDTYYFLSNNQDPNGNAVEPGSTTFNLFQYTQSTETQTFLGSASSLQVTAVPEPSQSGLLFLGLPLFLGMQAIKKRNKSAVKQLTHQA